jgi:hypothetical protein
MRLVVPLALLIVAGCVDEGLNVSEDTKSVTVDNRIALNRIALNRIALNRIALNRIALNRIALNHLEANIGSIGTLLDTADGRELFSFVVSCALEEDVTLVVHHPTLGDLTFLGEIGLAPSWETRPLSGSDQRWISACLLARVNNNDVTVQVSLRGPDDALDTTATERAAWAHAVRHDVRGRLRRLRASGEQLRVRVAHRRWVLRELHADGVVPRRRR